MLFTLDTLRNAAAVCRSCELHSGRINPVFDKGNPKSNLLICGMVPAVEENNTGIPFVGRAGKLLDKILLKLGLTLDDVYVTNIVKCFVKPGISLKDDWIDCCLPFLINQMCTLKPKAIVTLGKDATIGLLGLKSNTSLGSVRGKVFTHWDIFKVIPTYHPSFLERNGGINSRYVSKVIEDFSVALNIADTS